MSPEIIELVEEELSSMRKKASLIGELLKYNDVSPDCPVYAHLEAAVQHIEQATAAARGGRPKRRPSRPSRGTPHPPN